MGIALIPESHVRESKRGVSKCGVGVGNGSDVVRAQELYLLVGTGVSGIRKSKCDGSWSRFWRADWDICLSAGTNGGDRESFFRASA